MPNSAPPKSGYIPTLDGWRTIAVALVLLAHAPALPAVLQSIQPYGSLGVDLFFAISGLLICSRLLDEERLHGTFSLSGFYIRRTCRIMPPAFLYLLVIGAIGLLHIIPMDWPAWGSAFVFLRNYFTCLVRDTPANRFTGHFWSLAVEEHFYLILPALLLLFPRRRKLVLFSLTVIALLWLALYLRVPPQLRSIYWERRTDLCIAALLFPAWLALFFAEPARRLVLARFLRPSFFITLFMLVIALFAVRHHFHHPPPSAPLTTPPSSLQSDYLSAPRGGDANKVDLLIPLFPLFILSTVLHPKTLLGRLLESMPMRKIGRVSYSIYLWQQLLWVTPYRQWPIAHLQQPLIAILLTAVAAIASYRFIEKPFIRLGHRLAPPPTPGHRDLDSATSDTPRTS